MLSHEQIEGFIRDGYVRVDHAFSPEIASACREILWRDTGCDPNDPTTWTRPVVWLWSYSQEPFLLAANSEILVSSYDQLVGANRWAPIRSVGTIPVRFPTQADTGDTGWHIDASFAGTDSDPNDFLTWKVNVHSKGRALLMLFLFSDVGELDAPTRLRAVSHMDVARILEPAGEEGLPVRSLDVTPTAHRSEVLATGKSGTVYLCHPFLVHAAQINRGNQPRFMAQPALFPRPSLTGAESAVETPVEEAIRQALDG